MKNYDEKYERLLDEEIQKLKSEFEQLREDKNHIRLEVLINDFNSELHFRSYGLIEMRTPNVRGVVGHNSLRNIYKEELSEVFDKREKNYIKDCVSYFIKDDFPKLKAKHLVDSLDKKNAKFYEWDIDFIKSSTPSSVLSLLAKHNSLKIYYQLLRSEKSNDKIIDHSNLATTAQMLITLMEIQKKYKIYNQQDDKPFIEFMSFITGRNADKIKKLHARYKKGDIHLTVKKNIEDYSAVKKIFERIGNQDLTQAIEAKINKLK